MKKLPIFCQTGKNIFLVCCRILVISFCVLWDKIGWKIANLEWPHSNSIVSVFEFYNRHNATCLTYILQGLGKLWLTRCKESTVTLNEVKIERFTVIKFIKLRIVCFLYFL